MGAKLLYRDAQGRDASVDILADGAFLGRGADCAVRTDDAMVSRKNCKISFQAGKWVVEDLGSSNGTFVNETRVQKQGLAHADVIRCGSLQVRFVEVADAHPVGKPKTMSLDISPKQPSIQVSPELTGPLDPANLMALKDTEMQSVSQERDALAARLQEIAQEMEGIQARHEVDQEELKRLRTEAVQSRERLGDLGRQKSLQDEELHAQHKLTEEMRAELAQLRAGYHSEKVRADELAEEMAARERQLERAQDDMQRAKTLTEELRNAMAELQKTKDEGWRELNNRVGELDNLREVISEQERILEERRVGLISLEASIKEMRTDREKVLREMVQIKSERDQLRENSVKLQANVDALMEEHRRLARAMADGGGGSANDEHMRLATELREAKVEVKKLENDRNRLSEQVNRLEAERTDNDDKHAKVDVERNTLREQKASVDAARARVEEQLARAETARQRADEERVKATQARDAALASADELRRELERERKRAGEFEDQLAKANVQLSQASELGTARTLSGHEGSLGGSTAPNLMSVDDEYAEGDTAVGGPAPGPSPLALAESRISALEEELSKLATELAIAKESASSHGNGASAKVAAAGGMDVSEIKRRAGDAYTGINDALSELRTNILLAKDLVAQHGPTVPDTDAVRTLEEAIQISMDRTEDAKGLLRSLREVVET